MTTPIFLRMRRRGFLTRCVPGLQAKRPIGSGKRDIDAAARSAMHSLRAAAASTKPTKISPCWTAVRPQARRSQWHVLCFS